MLHDATHLVMHAEGLGRYKQPDRETLFVRLSGVELLEDLASLSVPAVVLQSLAQIESQFANGPFDSRVAILIRRLDVAQRDHLLQRFPGRRRIRARMRRMLPIRAGHIFPA